MNADSPSSYPTSYSIKPGYVSSYYDRSYFGSRKIVKSEKIKQPRNNKPKRSLSDKARKRLRDAINWLYILSAKKEVQNNTTKRTFNFRLNFITLTLPATQFHSDKTIKRVALNGFLDTMRKYHGLLNYVWRAECQRNGSIHFHLVSDSFLNWYVVRNVWNRQMKKLGYIEKYRQKHTQLTEAEYIDTYTNKDGTNHDELKKRYAYGQSSHWKSPNTTDIHALYKVRNVTAYVSSYMTKGEKKRKKGEDYETQDRRIEGKLWGLSQSLSKIKSIVVERSEDVDKVLNKAINWLRCKYKVERYYSLIYVNVLQLKKLASDWIGRLLAEMVESVGYKAGGQQKKVYYYT